MGVNYQRRDYLSAMKAAGMLKGQTAQVEIEPITDTELIIHQKAC